MTYSTNLALIEAVNEIYSKLYDCFCGIGIYLDLQKAFDTVNYDISLKNLNTMASVVPHLTGSNLT